MRRHFAIAAVIASTLVACSPEPRSSSYFEGHPDETAKVLTDCKSGVHRGQECVNAETADAKFKSNARMALYESGFK